MDFQSDKAQLAVAQLPARLREAVCRFKELTGLTAVTALRPISDALFSQDVPLPPVHPRCAKRLRHLLHKPPCDSEWRTHVREGRASLESKQHVCPLGLHCACIPIRLGNELMGLAKIVSGPEVAAPQFRRAVDLLELVITRPCQELYAALLTEEIEALRRSVKRLCRAKRPTLSREPAGQTIPPTRPQSRGLVTEMLNYLNAHFTHPGLSLAQVASAVRKNEKYIAHLFTQQVGERMRTYIIALRVRRACELLLETDREITQVASDSGFTNLTQFRRLFRSVVGVSATQYRQIFHSEG